ncbi:MAG TPA: hypothetical protein PLA12_14295, partial [Candidatus Hydrogenedens sp.]|nr:hypothetical protein [Candidatus Hydrogenedens sp.]
NVDEASPLRVVLRPSFLHSWRSCQTRGLARRAVLPGRQVYGADGTKETHRTHGTLTAKLCFTPF